MHNVLIAHGAPASEIAGNANQIRAVTAYLAGMLSKDAPYLAMLREWILKRKQAGDYSDLLQFGIGPESLI